MDTTILERTKSPSGRHASDGARADERAAACADNGTSPVKSDVRRGPRGGMVFTHWGVARLAHADVRLDRGRRA